MHHEIKKTDRLATWSAHCSCGWSEPLLFGDAARDLSVDWHVADLRSNGDLFNIFTVDAQGQIVQTVHRQSVAQSVLRRLAPKHVPYTWESLASDSLASKPGRTYLISLNGTTALVLSDHEVMSCTVMAYQRAGWVVLVQVVLDNPTEDELHAAGFKF